MKLPKNYFENLTISKYREYLKLLPDMQHENTRIITTLILTFTAMSFFGIFAINPTLSTIVTLKKQLSDSQLVDEKLGTKVNNLSTLQQQYSQLNVDLSTVFEAIPATPQAPSLMGQIFALSQKTRVQTTSVEVSNVQLIGGKEVGETVFAFSLQVQGSYADLMNFAKSLTKINRIISVDSLSITKDAKLNGLVMDIRGRGYFKH